MRKHITEIICGLIVRFIGSLLVAYGYNTIAYEFNLPTFSCLVFFTLAVGLKFMLNTFSPTED